VPGLVARELAGRSAAATAGERQFQQLGLTGARGEAESGFATVRRVWRSGTAASFMACCCA
jgi:triphosphoribosyl-dephospho-CoA synthase